MQDTYVSIHGKT